MTFVNRLSRAAGAAFLLLSALSGTASAASSGWFTYEHGAVRLVSATADAGAGRTVDLGLQFRMLEGWKVYWRSPGDAGFPPLLDWSGSANLASASLSWPAPERFSVLGLETIGYHDEVLFPVSASLLEPGKELAIRARLRFLTCSDICVPYETNLALTLPPGPGTTTPEAAAIDGWRARVPATGGEAPLSIGQVEIAGSGKDQALVIHAAGKAAFANPDVFVEGPDGFGFGRPAVQIEPGGRGALMRVAVHPPGKPPSTLDGKAVTLTLVDGDRALEHRAVAARAAAAPGGSGLQPAATTGLGLLAILGLALVGGLILNLMPCVLPVLSLKLLAIVSHGGEAPGRVRAGFLASAAGIVACFLLLATVVAALSTANLAAGWGIQFQQPAFLAFMLAVITLFVCNMWGFFEIRLPGRIADAAAGSGGAGRGALAEHFLGGAFATLLATPCTAPFLGTAVGFALMRGPLEIYAVFLALGAGLALPWLAVAAFPALINKLPKPGHWMITVKRILSLALVGTGAWLLSILWPQIGAAASGMLLLLMAVVAYAVWQAARLSGTARLVTWGLVAALTVISMVTAGSFGHRDAGAETVRDAGPWVAFDESRIAAEVAAGRTVLVDVTADWCLTCQFNKSLVLDRGGVAALIQSGAIVAMRADWTMPDARIADYLRGFGRFGIPFNVVYGTAAPRGIALPELLTEANVLGAIEKAAGKTLAALR